MSIRLDGVSKRLGRSGRRTEVLRSVSCTIPSERVVGLLGRNGAGKTTLFRILMGHVRPNRGSIAWSHGKRPRRMWLPEGRCFAAVGSAQDWQGLFAPLATERLRVVRDMLDVDRLWRRPVGQLSTGERRRVELALTLGADAEVFLLDEPTSGLDPIDVEATKSALIHLTREGKTVVVSTHLVREHEDMVESVLILDGGRVVASGSTRDLCDELVVETTEEPLESLPAGVVRDGENLLVPASLHASLAETLRAAGIRSRPRDTRLRDVFIAQVAPR